MHNVPVNVILGMIVRAPIELPWVLDTAPSNVTVIAPLLAGAPRVKGMPFRSYCQSLFTRVNVGRGFLFRR